MSEDPSASHKRVADLEHDQAPSAAAASAAAVATAAPASPAALSSRFDPDVHHLAVYGSLRDDDDSGAAWTARFLEGLGAAEDGRVAAARLFWCPSENNYPRVLMQLATPENGSTHPSRPAAQAPSAEVLAAAASSDAPVLCVRLLSWPTRAAFEAKMIEADEIEEFDPQAEDSSEYVRRRVWVQRAAPLPPVQAWIYVMIESKQPGADWILMKHGSWMQRDRALWKPKQ